jgi:hypothetical protein
MSDDNWELTLEKVGEKDPLGNPWGIMDNLKKMFVSLSLGDHMGDIANTLDFYAPKFGLEKPKWCYECERWVWNWEEVEEDPDEHQHEFDE